MIKHVLEDLVGSGSEIIDRATMTKDGNLTNAFEYLQDYAGGV